MWVWKRKAGTQAKRGKEGGKEGKEEGQDEDGAGLRAFKEGDEIEGVWTKSRGCGALPCPTAGCRPPITHCLPPPSTSHALLTSCCPLLAACCSSFLLRACRAPPRREFMTRKLKDMGLSGPVKMPSLEFSVGDDVELRSDDDGYVGARFKAAVLEVCAAERRAKVRSPLWLILPPTAYCSLLTTG